MLLTELGNAPSTWNTAQAEDHIVFGKAGEARLDRRRPEGLEQRVDTAPRVGVNVGVVAQEPTPLLQCLEITVNGNGVGDRSGAEIVKQDVDQRLGVPDADGDRHAFLRHPERRRPVLEECGRPAAVA